MVFSTASGLIAWSNETNIRASRRVICPFGIICKTFGGGVVNVQMTSFWRTCPVADFVPAGTRAVNFVAIGKRFVVSNISVFVPSQRQRPSTWGESSTGANFAASSCDVTATIGCEKVTLRSGASGISPSGEYRMTSRACLAPSTFGTPIWLAAGKFMGICFPFFGAGSVPMRLAKSVWSSGSDLICGSLFRMPFESVSDIGSVDASGCLTRVSAPSAPLLNRNFRPA